MSEHFLVELARTIAKILNETGELRHQPTGRVRSKVSTQKQLRRVKRAEIPQLRLLRRLLLQLKTGAFRRAFATEAHILKEWPNAN